MLSTVTTLGNRLLKKRSENIKAAHGQPVEAQQDSGPRLSSDSNCDNSGSLKVTQIADHDVFTQCDYLLSEDGPAIAYLNGT
jgi:hypothetical protein